MPGERTIVRIYVDSDDALQAQWFCKDMDRDDLFKLIGMLELIKQKSSDMIDIEDIEDQTEIDNIKKLLDE